MRIVWRPRARDDLLAILEYIARDNPGAAVAILDRIERQVEQLAGFPELGRFGRLTGTRELVVTGTPYIAAYEVAGERIRILRVCTERGSRRQPSDEPRGRAKTPPVSGDVTPVVDGKVIGRPCRLSTAR